MALSFGPLVVYLVGAIRVVVERSSGAIVALQDAATGEPAEGHYRAAYLDHAIAQALSAHRQAHA